MEGKGKERKRRSGQKTRKGEKQKGQKLKEKMLRDRRKERIQAKKKRSSYEN